VEYIIENIFRRFFPMLTIMTMMMMIVSFRRNFARFLAGHNLSIFETFFPLSFSLSLPIFLLLIRPFKVETILFWKHKEENIKIPSTKMKWKSLYKIVNYCLKHNVDIWQIPSSFNFVLSSISIATVHCTFIVDLNTSFQQTDQWSTYQRSCGNSTQKAQDHDNNRLNYFII
jgi:hypothetical protein